MSKTIYHTNCDSCGSKDNLAVYINKEGTRSGYCFGLNCRKFYKEAELEVELLSQSDISYLQKQGTVYPYTDASGNIVKAVVRKETATGKTFRVYSRLNNELVAKDNQVKCLFIPDLQKFQDCKVVLVVEGEKAALAALKRLSNICPVTWQGGAVNTAKGDWDLLKGKNVYLMPDNDDVGREAMLKINELLDNTGTILNTRHFPPKGDIADADVTEDMIIKAFKVEAPKVTKGISSKDLLSRCATIADGIPSYIDALDKLKIRIPEDSITVIHGRTSHGKSTLLIDLALRQLTNSTRRVHFLSLEMPLQFIFLKMALALEPPKSLTWSGLTYAIRNGLALPQGTEKLISYLDSGRLVLMETPTAHQHIIKYIETHMQPNDMLFIDYAQYIKFSGNNDSRYSQLKIIFEDLQGAAKQNKVMILTAAQVTSQGGSKGDDSNPNEDQHLSDVAREGKDIDNASALVLKVFNRDAGRARNSPVKKSDYNATLSVLKNRYGIVGASVEFDMIDGLWCAFQKHDTAPTIPIMTDAEALQTTKNLI